MPGQRAKKGRGLRAVAGVSDPESALRAVTPARRWTATAVTGAAHSTRFRWLDVELLRKDHSAGCRPFLRR